MKFFFIIFVIIFVAAIFLATGTGGPATPTNFNLPVILGEIIGGVIVYEGVRNFFALLAAALIVFLLIRVQASKWLFMCLLAGALIIGEFKGLPTTLVVATIAIAAIMGVFRFLFSQRWEKIVEIDDRGNTKTTEQKTTKVEFRGEK